MGILAGFSVQKEQTREDVREVCSGGKRGKRGGGFDALKAKKKKQMIPNIYLRAPLLSQQIHSMRPMKGRRKRLATMIQVDGIAP